MLNWLAAHITLPYILVFVAGLLAGYAINWYMCYLKFKKLGTPMTSRRNGFTTIVGIIIVITMVWIMVSTQQARNCAINLNVAVVAEQKAATLERNGFQNAIQQSLSLPPDILALPQNDPRRKALTDPITAEYLKQVAEANKLRENGKDEQNAARKACGR
jgi:predicted PurR-regulated permease PerM